MTVKLFATANSPMACMGHGWPPKCTGMTALVFAVIFRLASSTFKLKWTGSTSTSTGFALRYVTTSPVAAKVSVGINTSSPSLRPAASRERCSAAVQELTARACRTPIKRANDSSKHFVLGPVVIHPLSKASVTARIASSPIEGTWKGTDFVTVEVVIGVASQDVWLSALEPCGMRPARRRKLLTYLDCLIEKGPRLKCGVERCALQSWIPIPWRTGSFPTKKA